ncbi:MAG TPA: hypothetical protein VF595_16075 [Tepidisphaeraceae bacterium]|jgi:hypothetical protein
MTLATPRNAAVVQFVLIDGDPQDVAAVKAQVSQPTVSRILKRFRGDLLLVLGRPLDDFDPESRRTMVQQLLGNAAQGRTLLAA